MSAGRRPTVLVSSYYYPAPVNPERWFHAAAPMAYLDALRLAGGVPLVAPPLDDDDQAAEALARAGAVLLVGGPDLDPVAWGEPVHPRTVLLHPRRNRSDLLLARAAWDSQKPLLGICGGMQAVNVALGGSLHQHLPEAFPDLAAAESSMGIPDDHFHTVRIEPGTRLAGILGAGEIEVNSAHHQAVDRVGRSLCVAARSAGGIVEALEPEDQGRFALLLQWHPERLAIAPPLPDRGEPPAVGRRDQLAIFEAFVREAGKRRRKDGRMEDCGDAESRR